MNSEVKNVSNPGVGTFLVYEDCVQQVMDMVETEPELIAQAQKVYENKIKAQMVRDGVMKSHEKLADVDRLNPDVKAFFQRTSLTLYSVFRDINERELKPLISCKILRAGVMPELRSDPLAAFRAQIQPPAPPPPVMDAEFVARAIAMAKQMDRDARDQIREKNGR
jgi:hypothetical protein